jgi:hypothetical protein
VEKKLTGLWYSTSHRYRLITMLILVLVPASLSLLLGKKTVTFIEFFCFHSRYIDIQSKYRQVNKVKKEKNFRCKEGLLKVIPWTKMNEDKKNIWLMIMSEKKKTIKELIFTNL